MVKALAVGVAGEQLTPAEQTFLRQHNPWGMVLFARNCSTAPQIAALVNAFRDCVGRADAPVLIDQEGGRVQRIKPPLAPKYPAGQFYADLYLQDAAKGTEAALLGGFLIGRDLFELGINVNCAPVADVRTPSTHDVIGDRALGQCPDQVAELAAAQAEGLLQAGVLPIVKHCPGHGRSRCDSHHELPVVSGVDMATLQANDFAPFKKLVKLPAFMTAHLKYDVLDPDNPATTSAQIIAEVIRGEIGFDGLLFSDDISMNALAGSISTRTAAAFAAGVEIVLHCNGLADERDEAAAAAPTLDGEAQQRAARCKVAPPNGDFDPDEAAARFTVLMAQVGYEFAGVAA